MSPAATAVRPLQPPRHTKLDALSGRLAALGASLGIIAGLVDVAVGSSIRGWIGNKLNPAPLGLATVLLSAVALAGAVAWHRSGGRDGDRRLATILAFLLPAGIGFTTIGRLWYLPGVLLLTSAVLVTAASPREQLAHAVNRNHLQNGLVALLGAYYVFLGGDTLPKTAGVLGVLGGVAIWAALIAARRAHRLAVLLLVAGALPFALATWWSVVTPLIALLVLTLGPLAIRAEAPDPPTSQPAGRSRPGQQPIGVT